MSEIYEKNMKAFSQSYPQYSDILQSLPDVHLSDFLQETQQNEKQAPGFVEANLSAESKEPARVVMFLGLYFGLEVLYYGSTLSAKKQTTRVIILEHDVLQLKKAMHAYDLTEILGHANIRFILLSERLFSDISEIMIAENTFYSLGSFKILYNFEYFESNKNTYTNALEVVRHAINYSLMHYGNDAKDSIIGVRNMLANYKEIANNPGINLLQAQFLGVPAVCVAAGPSLDKNIGLLKEIQDKAVIFCVDAALKPLLAHGVRPHFVTSLERELAVSSLFKGIDDDLDGIYLAACPVVYPDVYEVYTGPRLIVYRQFDHFKWLGIERGMLPIKASPGNMNFSMASYMGCDPIILVGQDLAIDGQKTNVQGTAHQEGYADTYLREPQRRVKGNYEDTVITTRSLGTMLDGFNCDVAGYIGTCINATEGGAYIEGTVIMQLREAMDEYCNIGIDVPSILKDVLKLEENIDETAKVLVRVKDTVAHFNTCIKLCNKALKRLKGSYNDHSYITDIKNYMSKDPLWQLYFMHLGQSVIIGHEIRNLAIATSADVDVSILKEFFEILRGLLCICISDLTEFKKNIEEENKTCINV